MIMILALSANHENLLSLPESKPRIKSRTRGLETTVPLGSNVWSAVDQARWRKIPKQTKNLWTLPRHRKRILKTIIERFRRFQAKAKAKEKDLCLWHACSAAGASQLGVGPPSYHYGHATSEKVSYVQTAHRYA